MVSKKIRDAAAVSTAERAVLTALSAAHITGEVSGKISDGTIVVTARGTETPAFTVYEILCVALTNVTGVRIVGTTVAITFPLSD